MQGSQWLTDLAAQANLWTIQYKDTLPSMLVAEWENLERLAKDGQVYGVLLQCRDLLEGVLKVPVVMALAILDASDERKDDPAYVEVIRHALEKTLSMGDWHQLASRIEKKQSELKLPENLTRILQHTIKLYKEKFPGDKPIVKWRNDTIGHGSLRFEADEEYQADINWLLPKLSSYFDGNESWSINSLYVGLTIQCGNVQLKGDNFANPDETAQMQLIAEGKVYPIQHFAANNDLRCMLFDSFYPDQSRSKTKYASYSDGRELLQENRYFNDLYEKYIQKNPAAKNISRHVTAVEEQMLAQLDMPNDYVKPIKLRDKLTDEMKALCKGVILIQMERGTGKSAFAGKLSGLYQKKSDLMLKDRFVRCYHVATANMRGLSDFVNVVNYNFSASFLTMNQLVSTDSELPHLTQKTETPAVDFAEFLNFYNEEYREIYEETSEKSYKGTVFVLDGIDELTERTERLLDYIPTSDKLDDGVFVLLLSRFEDEETVLGSARESIRRAKDLSDKVIAVPLKDDINLTVLREYAKNNAPAGTDYRKLIEQAGYRMLYLKANLLVRERARLNTADETKFIGSYLHYVLSFYGPAHQHQIKETLAAIAMFHSVSLNQFVEYLDWMEITYGKIGIMNDLMPLFTVIHRDGETFYELANEEYAVYVLQEYADAVEEILRRYDTLLQQTIDDIAPDIRLQKSVGINKEALTDKCKTEKLVLFLGNGIVSLFNQRYQNDKIRKYFYNEINIFYLYEILHNGLNNQVFNDSFNMNNLLDNVCDSLLMALGYVVKAGERGPVMKRWGEKIAAWYRTGSNIGDEIWVPFYKWQHLLNERPLFKKLVTYILQQVPNLNEPEDFFWVLILSDKTQEIENRLKELNIWDRFCHRFNEVPWEIKCYTAWGHIIEDEWSDNVEEESIPPYSFLQQNELIEEVLKSIHAGHSIDYGYFEELSQDITYCYDENSGEKYIRSIEERSEMLRYVGFARMFLDWLDNEISGNRCDLTFSRENGLKGLMIPLLCGSEGNEETQWFPRFCHLQQSLISLGKRGNAEAEYLAGVLQEELYWYYIDKGNLTKAQYALEKYITHFEFEKIWLILLPSWDENAMSELERMDKPILCTDAVLLYLQILYLNGEKGKGIEVIREIESSLRHQATLPTDNETTLNIREMQLNHKFVFERIRKEYGLEDYFDPIIAQNDEAISNDLKDFFHHFSGNSDAMKLNDLVSDYLEPIIQLLDWQELTIRCNWILDEFAKAERQYGVKLGKSFRKIQAAVACCRDIPNRLAEWDWKTDWQKDWRKVELIMDSKITAEIFDDVSLSGDNSELYLYIRKMLSLRYNYYQLLLRQF